MECAVGGAERSPSTASVPVRLAPRIAQGRAISPRGRGIGGSCFLIENTPNTRRSAFTPQPRWSPRRGERSSIGWLAPRRSSTCVPPPLLPCARLALPLPVWAGILLRTPRRVRAPYPALAPLGTFGTPRRLWARVPRPLGFHAEPLGIWDTSIGRMMGGLVGVGGATLRMSSLGKPKVPRGI